MTTYDRVLDDLAALPAEAQQQAADFITFLRQRYQSSNNVEKARRTPMNAEPFIGMWQEREDMQDSTAWVRGARQQEWEKRHG